MAEPTERDREMATLWAIAWKARYPNRPVWPQLEIDYLSELVAAAREEGRREERERCLTILDEEGWLGLSKQRMESP